jgi:DNA-binding phage protein
MDNDELIALLRRREQKAGGLGALASQIGVSQPYLWRVLNKQRDAGPSILRPLGLVRTFRYVPIASEKP